MRLTALAPLFALLFALSCPAGVAAQTEGAPRIAEIGPYDSAAPGQIVELRVEGIGERLVSPPAGDALQILLTQDGATQTARARTSVPVFIRAAPPAAGDGAAPPAMKAYQGITFVVPRGLRAGEAEVVVAYRSRRSAPFKLNIVERPPRPVVGSSAIKTISPASLPPPPHRAGDAASRLNLGLKFERGAKRVEMHVRPLADPEDAEAGVLVRFKQGGTYYDAEARVVHHAGGTQNVPGGRGFRLTPPRDVLELDVPELLAPGEAEIEVRLRAAGQTGEAALVPVTITDAERAYEAPAEAAPRMLLVTPSRVGAGQPVMISVDRRRALDPDPSKTVVLFETPDGARNFKVRPERNSAVLNPDTAPDAPVLIIARTPEGLTGAATVSLVNPARADYEGASSKPAQIEVVAEALPPEVLGVAEATKSELAQVRQTVEAGRSLGHRIPEWDPSARYVTIRATGLDPNPKFLRVRLEQDGRSPVTLSPRDFALFSNNSVIVRVPKGLGAGATRLSVENRGAAGYSAPVVRTFELSARP